jgi:ribose 5-phosphate isomerase B
VEIVFGADHGGFELKEAIIAFLVDLKYEIIDVGCTSTESVDYPDFAEKAVSHIIDGSCRLGILICGTGIGMSIAANRHMEIRAANCHSEYTARMSREHNDANVLCLGARVVDQEQAFKIVRTWLVSEFVGGRHQRRIAKFSG